MKLDISNLAQRWIAVSTNEKMQNRVKWGHVGSLDPNLDFWDPTPIISRGRMKLEISNLAQRWIAVSTKKCKIWSKGVTWG